MSFPADQILVNALEKRREQNAFRKLSTNNHLINFCSNDYLGFASSPELAQAIQHEIETSNSIANGSGGSRLLAGNTAYAETLEKKTAAFHNAESGLIYNSGYDANVGLFSAIDKKTLPLFMMNSFTLLFTME